MFNIFPIPALKDNYIWCLVNNANRSCIIVDPGEAKPAIDELNKNKLNLSAILVTHHHGDHINGIREILCYKRVPVFGPPNKKISFIDHPLDETQICHINSLAISFKILFIPGHTHDHIAYYHNEILFCGDTLFTAGCGRIFEGNAAQLFDSLTRLSSLPDKTLIYCAHEYTLANLHFALTVEPNNKSLQLRFKQTVLAREENLPTVPSTLALEKMTNPFLRCNYDEIKFAAQNYAQCDLKSPVEVFSTLREWKNSFNIKIENNL